jgi:hypothetical protein
MNTNFPRGHRDGFQNTLDCKVTPRGHAKDGEKISILELRTIRFMMKCSAVQYNRV